MSSECPQCGQKLMPKWVRCPRCRLLLPEAPAIPTRAPSAAAWAGIPRIWLGGVVGLLAVLALVGAIGGEAPPPPTARTAAAAVPRAAVETTAAMENSAVESASATVSFAAVDAKRDAAAAYNRGDHAIALTQLEAAVAASPADPESRNNLGQLLVRQGRTAEALPHFDEAVRLAAGRWAYRFNRARAYGLLNRWTDAIADYRVAAMLFPQDHATLYNLGLALLRVRDYPEAVGVLDQAVAAAPDEHEFLITLGTAYVGAAQSDRARATFERFLELAPNDAEAPRVKALLDALAAAAQ